VRFGVCRRGRVRGRKRWERRMWTGTVLDNSERMGWSGRSGSIGSSGSVRDL
jgi:hypothetical protein